MVRNSNAAASLCAMLLIVAASPAFAVRSAILRIHVARNGDRRALNLEVAMRASNQDNPLSRLNRKLPVGASNLVIRNLDAGTYTLILHGDDPLETLAEDIALSAGETRRVRFFLPAPSTIAGRLTLNGVPLAFAEVSLRKPQARWRSFMMTDVNGRLRSRSWLSGELEVFIRGGGLASIVNRRTVIHENATFTIDLPNRSLTGFARDSSGMPIAQTNVFLNSSFEDHVTSIRVVTGEDGRFEFAAVAPGTHSLTATAVGYLDSEPIAVDVGENTAETKAQVSLKSADRHSVTVVDASGNIVANALIVCASHGNICSKTTSDATGHAIVTLPSAEPAVLYVFAPASFAVIHTDPLNPALRLHLPRGDASLNLKTVSSDGSPLPSINLLMRFDGELIPHGVIEEADRQNVFSCRTMKDGQLQWAAIPLGFYEFWPYRTRDEADELTAIVSVAEAPVSVRAVPGKNTITVRFREHPSR